MPLQPHTTPGVAPKRKIDDLFDIKDNIVKRVGGKRVDAYIDLLGPPSSIEEDDSLFENALFDEELSKAFDIKIRRNVKPYTIRRMVVLLIVMHRVTSIAELLSWHDVEFEWLYVEVAVREGSLMVLRYFRDRFRIDLQRVVEEADIYGMVGVARSVKIWLEAKRMGRPNEVGCLDLYHISKDTYFEVLPADVVGMIERFLVNSDLHIIEVMCNRMARATVEGHEVDVVDVDDLAYTIKRVYIKRFGVSLKIEDVRSATDCGDPDDNYRIVSGGPVGTGIARFCKELKDRYGVDVPGEELHLFFQARMSSYQYRMYVKGTVS